MDNEKELLEEAEPAGVENESKADKFKRLATFRINKVIKCLDQIENLSNTSAYEYTPEMIDKMFGAMEKKLEETKAKFTKQPKEEKDTFSF